MKTLRWFRHLGGRLAATATTLTSADGAVLERSAQLDATDTRVLPSIAEPERLARIATLLTADTHARLNRIAALLTPDMNA